jgi:predicted signal transduction protein with EAL and GGDEF domain
VKECIATPSQLLDHLDRLIAPPGKRCALMLISLHGLKRMGSIFGARLSERIIADLVAQLEAAIRPDDLVIRSGRFEFAVFISGLRNRGHGVLAANKLAGILDTPIAIGTRERKFPFAIGMAFSPQQTRDPELLFRYAEIAARAAKITQTPYQIYSHDDLAAIVTDWDIEGDLDCAISDHQLTLHYQPKVASRSGRLLGAEALMRWRHPLHGMIPPDRFIPVAERMGIMPKLTWWCLNTALRERQEWGDPARDLTVAVNISALDLTDERFIEAVSSAIGLWDARPELLTLEITEGSLMQDIARSADILKRLQDSGIRISIDDFGTGYSSLAYFKQLPADELKIDRSFILNILDDDLDRHIVSTIIQMARKLRLEIVAEGVETADMREALIELGCDIIQGYHIARPMPHAAFVTWARAHA